MGSLTLHPAELELLNVAMLSLLVPALSLVNAVLVVPLTHSLPAYLRIFAEVLCVAGPMAVSILHPKLQSFIGLAVLLLSVISCIRMYNGTTRLASKSPSTSAALRTAVTNVRASVSLLVAVVLLVVDCSIFPKPYFKSGTYGASLMDMGVGCVVASMGLTAGVQMSSASKNVNVMKAIKQSCLLATLGIARLVVTRALHVGVDPTEYGLHWNFFMTLAFLPLATCFAHLVLKTQTLICFTGIVVLGVYQFCIELFRLAQWIMSLPKDVVQLPLFHFINQHGCLSLQKCYSSRPVYSTNCSDMLDCMSYALHANRSGSISTIGYVVLLLLSISMGHLFCKPSWKPASTQALSCLSATACFLLLSRNGIDPSRRQANAAYVCAVLAIFTLNTTCFALLQVLCPTSSMLFDAMSRQQLFVFLAVNLVVGLCNVLNPRIIKTPSTIHLFWTVCLCGIAIVAHYLPSARRMKA